MLDENLPARLVRALRALGHDVEHVYTRNLSGHADEDVYALAQEEDRFLITQDRRFADARRFAPGANAGVMLVRLKRPGREALFEAIRTTFATADVESWRGCFVVLGASRLRVRRPA